MVKPKRGMMTEQEYAVLSTCVQNCIFRPNQWHETLGKGLCAFADKKPSRSYYDALIILARARNKIDFTDGPAMHSSLKAFADELDPPQRRAPKHSPRRLTAGRIRFMVEEIERKEAQASTAAQL